ncbi:MAG: hypothetical protein A2W90_03120 [Bacteroidetes bacterium GWF2_42_66]|nr:MAG: hypothetical protein A2W92_10515 [Bacteroidetes bacterium GWA2_42_15]OFY01329.1 MAG: hypothetical protein A2W89_16605 [Bacteroidetes bacterium GWE2_42_39]OFY42173.1 MAG: hypothetical protein A2W90_03120 [Bacteroidetes bacterium GWF2_42_66]HBL77615.1 Rrf2 family transcriptional regulator [Prolixibacteraceae bacterium]HCB62745.1 Rrf2 family transcriptional regulator [Bacteroidales bacterium]
MNFNSKIHCGIKVLVDIAVYDNGSGVFQKDIAERYEMSVKFLDHIIAALKTAGLIQKQRGYKYGYKLTIEPSSITMYDVYRAFEPELGIYPCVVSTTPCPRIGICATHCFLEEFNHDVRNLLEAKTIGDLKNLQIDLKTKASLGKN